MDESEDPNTFSGVEEERGVENSLIDKNMDGEPPLPVPLGTEVFMQIPERMGMGRSFLSELSDSEVHVDAVAETPEGGEEEHGVGEQGESVEVGRGEEEGEGVGVGVGVEGEGQEEVGAHGEGTVEGEGEGGEFEPDLPHEEEVEEERSPEYEGGAVVIGGEKNADSQPEQEANVQAGEDGNEEGARTESAEGDESQYPLHETGEYDYSEQEGHSSEAEEVPADAREKPPLHRNLNENDGSFNSDGNISASDGGGGGSKRKTLTSRASEAASDSEKQFVAVLPSETLDLKLSRTVRLELPMDRASDFSMMEMVEGPDDDHSGDESAVESEPPLYGSGAGKWLNAVIAKYEKAAKNPSKKRGRPIDDDDYDTEDPWIDDSGMQDEIDQVGTKYGGFFICAGEVEDPERSSSEEGEDQDGDSAADADAESELDDRQGDENVLSPGSESGNVEHKRSQSPSSLQPPTKRPRTGVSESGGVGEDIQAAGSNDDVTMHEDLDQPNNMAEIADDTAQDTGTGLSATAPPTQPKPPSQPPVLNVSPRPSTAPLVTTQPAQAQAQPLVPPQPIKKRPGRPLGRPRLNMPGGPRPVARGPGRPPGTRPRAPAGAVGRPPMPAIKRKFTGKEEQVFLSVLEQPLGEILRWMRQRDVNEPLNEEGHTPLHILAMEDKDRVELAEETIDLLTRHGANIDQPDNNGHTALHLAVMHDPIQLPLVRRLVQLRANINAQDANGDTALHVATRRGKVKTVKLLLEKGASTWLENKHGQTAFDEAQDGNVDNARELCKIIRDSEVKFMRELRQGGGGGGGPRREEGKENGAGAAQAGARAPMAPHLTVGKTADVVKGQAVPKKTTPPPKSKPPLSFKIPPELEDLLGQLADSTNRVDGDNDKRARLTEDDVKLLADVDNLARSCHLKNRDKNELYQYLENITRVKKNTMKLRIGMYHLENEKNGLLEAFRDTLFEAVAKAEEGSGSLEWSSDLTQKILDVTRSKCKIIMRRFGRNQELIFKYIDSFMREEVMPLFPEDSITHEDLMEITQPAYILGDGNMGGDVHERGDGDGEEGGEDGGGGDGMGVGGEGEEEGKVASPESRGAESDAGRTAEKETDGSASKPDHPTSVLSDASFVADILDFPLPESPTPPVPKQAPQPKPPSPTPPQQPQKQRPVKSWTPAKNPTATQQSAPTSNNTSTPVSTQQQQHIGAPPDFGNLANYRVQPMAGVKETPQQQQQQQLLQAAASAPPAPKRSRKSAGGVSGTATKPKEKKEKEATKREKEQKEHWDPEREVGDIHRGGRQAQQAPQQIANTANWPKTWDPSEGQRGGKGGQGQGQGAEIHTAMPQAAPLTMPWGMPVPHPAPPKTKSSSASKQPAGGKGGDASFGYNQNVNQPPARQHSVPGMQQHTQHTYREKETQHQRYTQQPSYPDSHGHHPNVNIDPSISLGAPLIDFNDMNFFNLGPSGNAPTSNQPNMYGHARNAQQQQQQHPQPPYPDMWGGFYPGMNQQRR